MDVFIFFISSEVSIRGACLVVRLMAGGGSIVDMSPITSKSMLTVFMAGTLTFDEWAEKFVLFGSLLFETFLGMLLILFGAGFLRISRGVTCL